MTAYFIQKKVGNKTTYIGRYGGFYKVLKNTPNELGYQSYNAALIRLGIERATDPDAKYVIFQKDRDYN